jgi:hypothetical protein
MSESQTSKSEQEALAPANVSPKSVKADPDDIKRDFIKWLRNGNTFSPVGDVTVEEEILRSAYRIIQTMQGIFFERMKPKTAELYKFKSGPMDEVLTEIDKFWDLEKEYNKLGILHSRGILLYGPPGSGKTSLLHLVAEMIVNRGDVVFYVNDIRACREGLKAFRSVEPDRKVVVILEDADEFIRYDEQAFLQLLDGQDSVEHICYLATTNYIEKFPERAIRSGRFDKKVFIGQPPYEGRLVYLKNKLEPHEMESESEIENLAEETQDMSFGDLAELVASVYALKQPKDEVLARLKKDVVLSDETGSGGEVKRSILTLLAPAKAVYRAGLITDSMDLEALASKIRK